MTIRIDDVSVAMLVMTVMNPHVTLVAYTHQVCFIQSDFRIVNILRCYRLNVMYFSSIVTASFADVAHLLLVGFSANLPSSR